MKIFVFAYNRFKTMTTSKVLENERIDHIVLCHSEEDKQKFIECGTVSEKYIKATGNKRGLQLQRNFALDEMNDGEWGLFLNDDLNKITRYDDLYSDKVIEDINIGNISEYNNRFNTTMSVKELVEYCKKLIEKAEQEGINLIGFAAEGNPLHRAKRWSNYCLIDGRVILVRKTHLRFNEEVGVIEDHVWTADNILAFGKVLREAWICPNFKRCTKGGYGSIQERAEELRKACKYLIDNYPFMFEYRDKKGYPEKTQVRFKKLKI